MPIVSRRTIKTLKVYIIFVNIRYFPKTQVQIRKQMSFTNREIVLLKGELQADYSLLK